MSADPTDLEAALAEIGRSPSDGGELRLIVRRPGPAQREVVETARLSLDDGLVGDDWRTRGSGGTVDGAADLDAQLTIMNTRLMTLLAGSPDRWAAAGDQLYVDMDLSLDNLPIGARLTLGDAVLEISSKPHHGCVKFADRFGQAALRFVSTPALRDLRLRGVHAVVVASGEIRVGDRLRKVPDTP